MATLNDVRNYIGTPDRPVTLTEMKELTKEDRAELVELVAAELEAK